MAGVSQSVHVCFACVVFQLQKLHFCDSLWKLAPGPAGWSPRHVPAGPQLPEHQTPGVSPWPAGRGSL